MSTKIVSRRRFIRNCTICASALTLGLNNLNLVSASPIKKTLMNPSDNLWKWNIKAFYYTKTDRGIVCGLCPNACLITDKKIGICKTRVNFQNDLYAINYGNPCSINTDPIEKKPLYHFLPQTKAFSIATAGCNFTCLNCQNWQISQVSPFETENYDIMPQDVVSYALKNNCKSIAYTYAEPVVFYEYVHETSKLARIKGIKNVFISNGYINEVPLRALCKYLDAANINLKSFTNEIYKKLNGGTLDPVMKSLQIFKEEGVWLEITNLIVPGYTDDLDMIKKMCNWLSHAGLNHFPLHFNRFYPSYKLTQLSPTSVDILNKAYNIAVDAGIKYVYVGNVPGTNMDDTYCPYCKKVLIERKGYTVISNNMKGNNCGYCNKPIHGIWN